MFALLEALCTIFASLWTHLTLLQTDEVLPVSELYWTTPNPCQRKPPILLYYLLPFVVEHELCRVSLANTWDWKYSSVMLIARTATLQYIKNFRESLKICICWDIGLNCVVYKRNYSKLKKEQGKVNVSLSKRRNCLYNFQAKTHRNTTYTTYITQ